MAFPESWLGQQTAMGSAFDELKARTRKKAEEAAALRAEIQCCRFDAFQARLQLQCAGLVRAAGSTSGVLVPAHLCSGVGAGSGIVHGSAATVDFQQLEFRSLLRWLVENVDLNHQVVFECGGGDGYVMVGDRRVLLQRMASWPLFAPGATRGGPDVLKFSVPLDMQGELMSLIVDARSRGRLSEFRLQNFIDEWELVAAEVVSTTAGGASEPAIFLVHRETAQSIIVAHWPTVSFQCSAAAASAAGSFFDPVAHFGATPPLAGSVDADARAGGTHVGGIIAAAPSAASAVSAAAGAAARPGDRVEVEFEGEWFSGVLEWIEGDLANVKCDVDDPGVITTAPLASVRPTATPAGSSAVPTASTVLAAAADSDAAGRNPPEDRPRMQHHARARSYG